MGTIDDVTSKTAQPATALITGADAGVGRSAAAALAEAGLAVTLAGRSKTRLDRVADEIREQKHNAQVDVLEFDLASISEIKEAAAEYLVSHDPWSALLNLAEVSGIGRRVLTEDGFEWNFGVNFLGHFALTGLLLPGAAQQAKVVSLTSARYRSTSIRFHDLRFDNGYKGSRAFAQSKRAQLLFARELDRRCRSTRARQYPHGVRSVALQREPLLANRLTHPLRRFGPSLDQMAGEAAAQLVIDDHGNGGELFAPAVAADHSGYPVRVTGLQLPEEQTEAKRLWRISDQLTRVTW